MPLMPAICTQCKGALTVDPKEKSGVCPYCGTTFLNQDVINNYNITNVQNNVTNIGNLHADVVNVQDSKSADNLYKKAVTYLNFKDFNAAFTAFDEMTKTYPYDHRGWKGIILAYTRNLDKTAFVTADAVNMVKYYYDMYVKAKNFSGVVTENDPTDKYLAFARQCAVDNINSMCEYKVNAEIRKYEETYGAEGKEKAQKALKRAKEEKRELEKAKKRSIGRFIIIYIVIALILSSIFGYIGYVVSVDDFSSHDNSLVTKYGATDLFGDIHYFDTIQEVSAYIGCTSTMGLFFILLFVLVIIVIIKILRNRGKVKYSKSEYSKTLNWIKYNEDIINGVNDAKHRKDLDSSINYHRIMAQKEISLIK
ncbi:MAG: hypothetical protein E7564_06215 [Ruminococcaceae bacterium]|nr:hypothetical protein [Oscillospiraceae bacterium]